MLQEHFGWSPLAGRTISLIVAGGYSETLGISALFDSRYFDALASRPDTAVAKSLVEVRKSFETAIAFVAASSAE